MVLPCALQMSNTWWLLSFCYSLGLAKDDLEMLQNELIWNFVFKSWKLIYELHPNCSKFLCWGWILKAGTEEDRKHVQICCIYKEVLEKRWKFTLNQRRWHEEKALWSGTEKVRQESSSTPWNQESSTTDHSIGRRQLVNPSKDGKTHIHTPDSACACWEEYFPHSPAWLQSGRTAEKEPYSLLPRFASFAVAISPLLSGFRKDELPGCYLFCKTLKIIALIYKYTDRFCVCVHVCVCT